MKRKIRFVGLYILVMLLAACDFFDKKSVFHCGDDALSIDNCFNCKKSEEMRFKFRTAANSNSIQMSVYYENDLVASETLKNCTIFDDKNWDCSKKGTYVSTIEKMTEGKYIHYFEDTSSIIRRNWICAK